jgi:hypothetical protein
LQVGQDHSHVFREAGLLRDAHSIAHWKW